MTINFITQDDDDDDDDDVCGGGVEKWYMGWNGVFCLGIFIYECLYI